jgi:putative PIG3 family NAD(P)H quinone oxidoreductase
MSNQCLEADFLSAMSSPSIPETMRAVIQTGKTSADLREGTVPVPRLRDAKNTDGGRQLLIQVHYAALNRLDLYQAAGSPPPPGASDILGVEVAGIVVGLGDRCELGFEIGDAVMGIISGGGYAEYCVTDERSIAKIPSGISMAGAAAIPEAMITAYQLLFVVGGTKRGETVLLHAASSSIGQAAIQLAKLHGVTVLTTTRNDSKCAKCLELGADHSFKVGNDGKFADVVMGATNGRGVDVILDPVCGSYMADNVSLMAMDGRIVIYGTMGGGAINDEKFLTKLMAKRIQILPTTLRTRHPDYKRAIVKSLSEDENGFPAVAFGKLKIEVFATFSLAQAADAHALMTSNENTGKILLKVI